MKDKVFINPRSNKVLNICGANRESGGKLIIWPQSGAWNEKWSYDPASKRIENLYCGKTVDIRGA